MRLATKIGLLILTLPALLWADVYRWIDDNGVVSYGSRPPEGVTAERVGGAAPPAPVGTETPPAAAPATASQSDAGSLRPADRLTDQQREALAGLEAAEQERQDELARVRQANCERARGVLERLNAEGRLRVRDAAGRETAMSEDERRERIAEAQRGVVENCIN